MGKELKRGRAEKQQARRERRLRCWRHQAQGQPGPGLPWSSRKPSHAQSAFWKHPSDCHEEGGQQEDGLWLCVRSKLTFGCDSAVEPSQGCPSVVTIIPTKATILGVHVISELPILHVFPLRRKRKQEHSQGLGQGPCVTSKAWPHSHCAAISGTRIKRGLTAGTREQWVPWDTMEIKHGKDSPCPRRQGRGYSLLDSHSQLLNLLLYGGFYFAFF